MERAGALGADRPVHHQLNGHELEQILGHSGGQGSLVCCSPWGHKQTVVHDLATGQQ